MRTLPWVVAGCGMAGWLAQGEVAPVSLRGPRTEAWMGQRVPFYVELRALGSFVGAAAFDLPEVPGALLMKIGSPVVASQEIEGASWFVQTHEFALFSQRVGVLELPPFPVRFARRDGFVGPAHEIRGQVPGARITIERPPGSDQIGFLVTAESLDVTETWDSPPGHSEVGAVFKRTIVQRAPHIPGMALAPASTNVPAGMRVYPGGAEIIDTLERGDFIGARRETITYLLQQPGILTLPALTYVWFNPKTETLESKTLPGVTFEVAPAPVASASGGQPAPRSAWAWLLAAASVVGLGAWRAPHLCQRTKAFWNLLNPPERVAARELHEACRRHDVAGATTAWVAWRNMQDPRFEPGPELRAAVLGAERQRFGPRPDPVWRGTALARAFARARAAVKGGAVAVPRCALPELNPRREGGGCAAKN